MNLHYFPWYFIIIVILLSELVISFVPAQTYDGTRNPNDINAGQVILIKHFRYGYISDSGGGTLSYSDEVEGIEFLWDVEDPCCGLGNQYFKFKNRDTLKYLTNAGNDEVTTSSNPSPESMGTWRLHGNFGVSTQIDFNYFRRYAKIKSYNDNYCIQILNGVIELNSPCVVNAMAFTIEIMCSSACLPTQNPTKSPTTNNPTTNNPTTKSPTTNNPTTNNPTQGPTKKN